MPVELAISGTAIVIVVYLHLKSHYITHSRPATWIKGGPGDPRFNAIPGAGTRESTIDAHQGVRVVRSECAERGICRVPAKTILEVIGTIGSRLCVAGINKNLYTVIVILVAEGNRITNHCIIIYIKEDIEVL
ncbi:MAG: hypothetical protein A2Y76_00690 [Planctomycetes bacterium RBG_13_60_9]|nr:MAG: hypothetical protein A2Y76_00690 [Planctomycetes bacterium RBG_13_60_9]